MYVSGAGVTEVSTTSSCPRAVVTKRDPRAHGETSQCDSDKQDEQQCAGAAGPQRRPMDRACTELIKAKTKCPYSGLISVDPMRQGP